MPHTGSVFLVPSTHSRFKTPTAPPLPCLYPAIGEQWVKFNSEDVLESCQGSCWRAREWNLIIQRITLWALKLNMVFCSQVIRTRYNFAARWISRCPLPTLLGGYEETREIAPKRYKILQIKRVELVINPAIDTVFQFRQSSWFRRIPIWCRRGLPEVAETPGDLWGTICHLNNSDIEFSNRWSPLSLDRWINRES